MLFNSGKIDHRALSTRMESFCFMEHYNFCLEWSIISDSPHLLVALQLLSDPHLIVLNGCVITSALTCVNFSNVTVMN